MTNVLAGVDLGGTSVKIALAHREGSFLTEGSIPTESHRGPERTIERIGDHLQQLAEKHQVKIAGIGVGVPGLVDIHKGITRFLPNLESHWRNIPVADLLTTRMGCPVRILNDVRTATLAELKFGHGKGAQDISMVFMALGTGIGGGVVIDGQLRLGTLGAAGEIGHQTMLPDGPQCGCGNHGCLEVLASGPSISAEGVRLMRIGRAPTLYDLVEGDSDRVNTKTMAQAAEKDPSIHEAILRAAKYVGIAVANIVMVLHPELIVLGGGVAEMGALLVDNVRSEMERRIVGVIPLETIRVERSQLGDMAGVRGAVVLAGWAADSTCLGT